MNEPQRHRSTETGERDPVTRRIIGADQVVVEIKCVSVVTAIFEAQLITYMRLTKKRGGLILNFHSAVLKDGITRRVL